MKDKYNIIPIFFFLVSTLLFFNRFLSGEQILAFKDLSRYFYPLRYLMVEQVKAGFLPLWNPYLFCGFPLLATLQIGFFYPLTIIHYFLPFNLAFNYYTILHYFLAACFMYFLLRHYNLSYIAAFFGGLIFAFSGYLLSVSNMNTSLSSVIWLPLTLIFVDRMINPESEQKHLVLAHVLILSILLALQFLGGEPTIVYITVFFLAAYVLVFSKNKISSFLGLALSGLIGLGLVAVQLIPFAELIMFSDRAVRTGYESATMRSLPLREIITFIFPYFFGNPAQFGGYSAVLLGKNIQDWLISPYIGILPLIFVFLSPKHKRFWFFLLTASAGLLLSFGRFTPVYRLIFFVPGVSLIRYPVKYLFLTTFCLTLLSAFGFERLVNVFRDDLDQLNKILRRLLPFVFLSVVVFVLGFIYRNQIYYLLLSRYPENLPEIFEKQLASMLEFNLLTLFNLCLYLLGFIILLLMGLRRKIRVFWFAGLVIMLVILDLFANGAPIIVPAPAQTFSQIPDSYQLLWQDHSIHRFFYTPELEKENRLIFGENYQDALWEAKENFASNWHLLHNLQGFYGYESINPAGFSRYYWDHFNSENLMQNFVDLSLANVKYLVSERQLELPAVSLLWHKEKYGLNIYVYENKKVMPRAFMHNGRVSIEKYLPGKVEILTFSNQEGLLFLSDTYYPGWKVFVDGKQERVLCANNFFRSVKLSAGKHEVRFVYDPLSFKIGLFISLLTVLGMGMILFINKSKS